MLGVSNISFGLPSREQINRAFLAAALAAGLNLPILNPASDANMDTVRAFRVLHGEDVGAKAYIARYADAPAAAPTRPQGTDDIRTLILEGQKGGVRDAVCRLLEQKQPEEIINTVLIPTLDEVGEKFERGEFFLPQLLGAAQAAKEGFDTIASRSNNGETPQGDKIILATVQGDIHDIGKNIVKMLLQN